MSSNLHNFMDKHPDLMPIVQLHLMCWTDEFGQDIVVDVAETKEESKKQYDYYTSLGYNLVDQNFFGRGHELKGIIQCFKK